MSELKQCWLSTQGEMTCFSSNMNNPLMLNYYKHASHESGIKYIKSKNDDFNLKNTEKPFGLEKFTEQVPQPYTFKNTWHSMETFDVPDLTEFVLNVKNNENTQKGRF